MTKLRIDYYLIGVLVLNLATIILGASYLIFPADIAFWDIVGWVFLTSWMVTLTLPLLVSRVVDLHTPLGKRINHMSYITLLVMSLALITMFGMSFLISTTTSNAFSEIGFILILLYTSFFGCTGMNSVLAFMMLQQSNTGVKSFAQRSEEMVTIQGSDKETTIRRKFPLLHVVVIIACTGILIGMIYFAFLTLAGTSVGIYAIGTPGGMNGIMGLMASSFGWIFSIYACVAGVGGAKILNGLRKPRLAITFGIIGLVTGSILLAPMIATPFIAFDVDSRFGEAFGTDWQSRIPSTVTPYFKSTQLVAAQYFLPTPLNDCRVIKDISFYNGTVGIDSGLTLFFDAYLPPTTANQLPGANSTIIRIHGGGWMIGDKGLGNMPLMNQYFASQGYCVFDIQYGLNNQSSFLEFAKVITPEYLMGNFSINDMMRHIGIFCQFIDVYKDEYNANLSSTFISGGSAGGHLTCAVALAIASGSYASLFGSGITIKGYVPFYPANEAAQFIDGGVSDPKFYDPALLVSVTSPPCLVYQGTQDGLVNPEIPQHLKDKYSVEGNAECMVIYLPFAGHGSDMDFYGYYNQFFLYYMERFIYLYR
jgi:acetyl esterase/lipase